jgi:hypothetical protein
MFCLHSEGQEGKTGFLSGEDTSGRGLGIRKGQRRENIVEIFCTHDKNRTMKPVKNCSKKEG